MAAQVNRLPDPEDLAHLATVAVRPGTADARDAALSPAIERRRTDRRRMSHRVVPSNHIKHRLVCVPSPPGGSATQPAIGARSGQTMPRNCWCSPPTATGRSTGFAPGRR
jgi:hypothetical protein